MIDILELIFGLCTKPNACLCQIIYMSQTNKDCMNIHKEITEKKQILANNINGLRHGNILF